MARKESDEFSEKISKAQEDLKKMLGKNFAGDGQIMEHKVHEIPSETESAMKSMFWGSSHSLSVQDAMDFLVTLRTDTDRLSNMERDPGNSWASLPYPKAHTQGLTAGQKHWQKWVLQTIFNTHNSKNRRVMKENFGIKLPSIQERKPIRLPNKPIRGPTVDHLTVLPRVNRVDPQLAIPRVSEKDAKKGILSLQQRGLIPSWASIKLKPSPVVFEPVTLHSNKTRLHAMGYSTGYAIPYLMDDDGYNKSEALPDSPLCPRTSPVSREAIAARSLAEQPRTRRSTVENMISFKLPSIIPCEESRPSSSSQEVVEVFAVRYGVVASLEPEFINFRHRHFLNWTKHMRMLEDLEKLLLKFSVPVAHIHGDSLAALSAKYGHLKGTKGPSVTELMQIIVNRKEVENIMSMAGRRFLGPNGPVLAAICIQASWRGYSTRSAYRYYKQLRWAVTVISFWWTCQTRRKAIRLKLIQTRTRQLENHRQRAKKFAQSWSSIKSSRRVVIHLPSLGFRKKIRCISGHMGVRQNTQMGRLCEIYDGEVDVIYVCPVPVTDQAVQYYNTLLGLSGCLHTGNVQDWCDMSHRYTILVPEAVHFLSPNQVFSMSLSTLLKYSPGTLKHISQLISGREAYIVPGFPDEDDLAVADALDVPLLCPEPEVARVFSAKSGCKKLFPNDADGVEVPPHECDIHSLDQLYQCLARLVTDHLYIGCWLLKIDDEIEGRGVAYCEVTAHLQCFAWVEKQAERHGHDWSDTQAKEAAYTKILAEIPGILEHHTETGKPYNTWELFVGNFLMHGGIIEAFPDAASMTSLTVNGLIEPDGTFNVMMCADQIHVGSSFQRLGLSLPQMSVNPHRLNTALTALSSACYRKGIIGHVQLDFVTFVDPKTLEQTLWALDVRTQYSDSMAMFQLTRFLTHGTFSAKDHKLLIPSPPAPNASAEKVDTQQKEEDGEARYCVMSTHLYHTNLTIVEYNTFFTLCRSHGIGYDVKERQGTVFTLIDYFNRERLGMLTVNNTLIEALATFARNLCLVNQEVSTANLQGTSNFHGAIESIEDIVDRSLRYAETMRRQKEARAMDEKEETDNPMTL